MTTDPDKLRVRLEELNTGLEKFDRNLEQDLKDLQMAWARVNRVWEGGAYQEFVGSWNGIVGQMQEYVDQSRKFEAFLDERIEALRRFTQGGL